jgi:hypothetical protein
MAAKRVYVMEIEMWADNERDLPTEKEMEELVGYQMSGSLNEETNLECYQVILRKSYGENDL